MRSAERGKSGVRGVENEKCRKRGVWQMRSVENCRVRWIMQIAEC